jgi:hypothetical protein
VESFESFKDNIMAMQIYLINEFYITLIIEVASVEKGSSLLAFIKISADAVNG